MFETFSWPLGCDLRPYHPPRVPLCALAPQPPAIASSGVPSLSQKDLAGFPSQGLFYCIEPDACYLSQSLTGQNLN